MRALASIRETIDRFVERYHDGVIMIWGCTAAGKTGLSLELSRHYPMELISADARQVYKYLDIATSKVDIQTRMTIPHYAIDRRDPADTYSAGDRKHDTMRDIATIAAGGSIPCIVGGTGLYIDMIYKNYDLPDVQPQRDWRAVQEQREAAEPGVLYRELQSIDPQEAARHHPHSVRYIIRALEIYHVSGRTKTDHAHPQPVDRPLLMLGLWRDKPSINRRINQTVEQMVRDGLVDETRWLLRQGYTLDLPAMHTIGYREAADYLAWRTTRREMIEHIKRRTHAFAKKQRTRFRRYLRDMRSSSGDARDRVVYAIYDFDQESREIVGI